MSGVYGALATTTANSSSNNPTNPLLADTRTSTRSISDTAKRRWALVLMVLLTIALLAGIAALIIVFIVLRDPDPIDWRERFLSSIDAARINEYSQIYTAKPHIAGSQENNEYGELFRETLNSSGYNTELMTKTISNVWLSQYISSSLLQLNPFNISQVIEIFDLSELPIKEDPTSNTTARTEAYLGYSPSTDINGLTSYLIYVNYAARSDFEYLLEQGYDLNGLIGISRYGGTMFRGTKVQLAEEYGLLGLIIYNDPLEYGYILGDVFPNGTWLPPGGYQRGSIVYGDKCPGNPEPQRVFEVCGNVSVLPNIPAIPLGYGNAKILLSQLGGDQVPNINDTVTEWQGGLDFTYHIGGGDESVSILLNLNVQNTIGTPSDIFNVVGFIKGYKYQNESILIGNHRDAWIFGAADPISGTTCLLEIATTFGKMIKDGWRPKRNIYIASWDAEEFSLIGSTDFVEDFAEFVETELVAYINLDTVVSGHDLYIGASPFLSKVIIDKMTELKRPDNDRMTLYDDWLKQNNFSNKEQEQGYPLGDGSDFVPFVHSYNIPSVTFGFDGMFGTYHSTYDSYTWMKIVDPGFKFAVVAAQYAGLIALEFLENDILPYNLTNLGVEMDQWLNVEIPKTESLYHCFLNISHVISLQTVIDNYIENAIQFHQNILTVNLNDYAQVRIWNNAMRQISKQFLYSPGLPERKYFKNILVAPDMDNGYSSQVFPIIGQAIKFTECEQDEIDNAIDITTQLILNANDLLMEYLTF